MEISPASGYVLWVPKYWPNVGGTEFHSRHLAGLLSEQNPVTIVTHTESNSTGDLPLIEQVALTRTRTEYDRSVRILRVGGREAHSRTLRHLARHYQHWSIAKLIYQSLFNYSVAPQVKPYIDDALLIHYIYNGLTEAACLARDLAKERNIPFIFTPNVLDTSSKESPWNTKRIKSIYRSADQLIALTDHEAEWLESVGVDAGKINIVPYGPILEPEETMTCSSDCLPPSLTKHPYILFVGRLIEGKGYKLLLEAFFRLKDEHPELHLVIVAPEINSHLESVLQSQTDTGNNRIHFIENPTQSCKSHIIARARALCVPSTVESLGGIYLEAMGCAVPVIALDLPVSRCVIDHGQEGYLVKQNPESVARAIAYLGDNPKVAQQLGLQGKHKAETEYSWTSVGNKIHDIYTKAIDSRSNRKANATSRLLQHKPVN